jgi:hypothetical protein
LTVLGLTAGTAARGRTATWAAAGAGALLGAGATEASADGSGFDGSGAAAGAIAGSTLGGGAASGGVALAIVSLELERNANTAPPARAASAAAMPMTSGTADFFGRGSCEADMLRWPVVDASGNDEA